MIEHPGKLMYNNMFLLYPYLLEYNIFLKSLDFIWTMLSIVWEILHIDIGLEIWEYFKEHFST